MIHAERAVQQLVQGFRSYQLPTALRAVLSYRYGKLQKMQS